MVCVQECWRLLGQCHAENEEETQAIAALLKAVEFDPYNLEALLLLAVSHTNDGEQSRALNFLKSWLVHHPEYEDMAHGMCCDGALFFFFCCTCLRLVATRQFILKSS
jgi:hypothetical protein